MRSNLSSDGGIVRRAGFKIYCLNGVRVRFPLGAYIIMIEALMTIVFGLSCIGIALAVGKITGENYLRKLNKDIEDGSE